MILKHTTTEWDPTDWHRDHELTTITDSFNFNSLMGCAGRYNDRPFLGIWPTFGMCISASADRVQDWWLTTITIRESLRSYAAHPLLSPTYTPADFSSFLAA